MPARGESIYLDNNATTRLDPEVLEAMLPFLRDLSANPSSRHALGRTARRVVEDACAQLASSLGADPEEIVFTSGATEANNVAIRRGRSFEQVLVLATEHPSSLLPARELSEEGVPVWEIPVDADGRFVLPDLPLPERTLAIMQWANSETGVVQDLAELRRRLPSSAELHVDAVQAIGKIPVDFHASGATTLALSGHKIHGPPGIGALLVRKGTSIAPMLLGGQQQEGIRPGSEPVALIVGLGKGVEIAVRDLAESAARMRALRDRFEERLRAAFADLCINGIGAPRLPNTSNISLPGVRAEALLMALDLEGVRASSGTACASGSLEPSPVLLAMGRDETAAQEGVRFSFSRLSTDAESERAAEIVVRAGQRLRDSLRPM